MLVCQLLSWFRNLSECIKKFSYNYPLKLGPPFEIHVDGSPRVSSSFIIDSSGWYYWRRKALTFITVINFHCSRLHLLPAQRISLHFCHSSTLTLLIVVSLFSIDSLGHTHFSPFPLHSNGYCPREAWELAPDHWSSVIVFVVKSFQGKFFSSLRDSACEYCCQSKW